MFEIGRQLSRTCEFTGSRSRRVLLKNAAVDDAVFDQALRLAVERLAELIATKRGLVELEDAFGLWRQRVLEDRDASGKTLAAASVAAGTAGPVGAGGAAAGSAKLRQEPLR